MAETQEPRWYVVHTYSGYENKVKATIEKTVQNRGMEDIIPNVAVPVEEVRDTKDGKETVRYRKLFPGYCLVKMTITDEAWYIVRNTKGVTGFVGPNSKPIALSDAEVKKMGLEESTPAVHSVDYAVGDNVIIKSGAFEGFSGLVENIDLNKGTAKIKIFMFQGRETMADVEVSQIEKE